MGESDAGQAAAGLLVEGPHGHGLLVHDHFTLVEPTGPSTLATRSTGASTNPARTAATQSTCFHRPDVT